MAKDKNQKSRGNKRVREERDEFDQEVIDLARVTRVMAGGKRMRFRACVAIGDRRGTIGLGIAKGADVSLAMTKAANEARKNLVRVNMTAKGTIPHQARIRAYSAKILLKPAAPGTGIIAGSVLRQILRLTGLRDVVAKMMGTSNKINNAKAALEVLTSLRQPKEFFKKQAKDSEAKKDDEKKEKKPGAKKDTNIKAVGSAAKEDKVVEE